MKDCWNNDSKVGSKVEQKNVWVSQNGDKKAFKKLFQKFKGGYK